MQTKYDRIIAIDPDVERSGVAELEVRTRKLEVSTLAFPALMDYLQFMKQRVELDNETLCVVVEAGWMNASNWHTASVKSIAAAAKTGQNTGRNHETARKIAEMSRHYGLMTEEVKPLKKCWRGTDGKITQEELEYFLEKKGINGFPKRSNQDMRDSTLLCVIYSKL